MRDLYIDVSHEVLEDLKVRLRGARFPVVLDEQENSAGISVEFMKNLVDYWLTEYNWAAHQKILNSYRHGIYTIQGKELHALHAKPTKSWYSSADSRLARFFLTVYSGDSSSR